MSEGWQPAGLVVCGTPIGNLEDASPRLVRALGSVDVIACEDTRRTRALLSALGVPAPRLISYRQDNEVVSTAGVIALLQQGQTVALVTDAGMPVLSDPGTPLVRAAHEAGIAVTVVPGPSAASAAMAVAGVQSCHTFVGFLPRSTSQLMQLLRENIEQVLVAFEAPGRLAQTLRTIADEQPEREIVLCRELTKRHEQIVRMSARELASRVELDGLDRGEIVLVLDALAAAASDEVSEQAVALAQRIAAAGVRAKDAARIAAETFDERPNAVFRALAP